jgi:RNA polymerase sigma-70 factor, ECF subfamily
MHDVTFTDVERLHSRVEDADIVLQMNEDAFRAFYDRTARPVWLYLSRLTGDPHAADDLLQEAYFRFLRADRPYASDAHRRNYLYRIATNLARDRHRRRVHLVPVPGGPGGDEGDGAGALDAFPSGVDEGTRAQRRLDLNRAMARLKPRERALLWLAYAQGSSHLEIAESLGLKTGSVKALLFRARRRLAALLGGTS